MFKRLSSYVVVALVVVTLNATVPSLQPASTQAQVDAQFFAQTGKTITGRFLDYWKAHGGLSQQGYPISDLMSEKSDVDGKIYTVQYFERAVFESHPENSAPNDVLLSLLGVFNYRQKYQVGAPEQVPNTAPSSRLFGETGKRLGGGFLDYWNSHGGLAQQGYPISDEFLETSKLDGKSYKVQYFERAVFEYHPENTGTQYEVLLSQLGTFRYNGRQGPSQITPTATVVVTPVPTVAPESDCSGITTSADITVTPNCGPYGTEFQFLAKGFKPGELAQGHATRPDGTHGHPLDGQANEAGDVAEIVVLALSPVPGIWAFTLDGLDSQRRVIGYFKVTGPDNSLCRDGVPPPARNASVTPSCGVAGDTRFTFASRGFEPGEKVGVYLTSPDRAVYGSPWQADADEEGFVIGNWQTFYAWNQPGTWALTYEGVSSHRKAYAYFKLYKP